jgi:hypothetical protein
MRIGIPHILVFVQRCAVLLPGLGGVKEVVMVAKVALGSINMN